MKRRLVFALCGTALALAGPAAASASAAVEFGDPCIGSKATGDETVTFFGLSSSSDPLPLTAPSAGVITSWKLNFATPEPPNPPFPKVIPQTLQAVRVDTTAKTVLVLGESSGMVGSGTNTFPARIPVQPGDHLAIFGKGPTVVGGESGELGTLYCQEAPVNEADRYGGFEGAIATGASSPYQEGAGARTPAVAVLEADADNDGFGDETQDGCPQSASTQSTCPVVKLRISRKVTSRLVKISITGTVPSNVTVKGKVALGKGKKAKMKGGTKAVVPGAFTKFKLKFPAKLIKRLKELPPSKKLTLKITSTAPNLAAAPTKKILKVKLKGQGPTS